MKSAVPERMIYRMNMISVLLPAFRSAMGEVTQQDIFRSLELMGKGMLGILVVMILIFFVIKGLNAVSGSKKKE